MAFKDRQGCYRDTRKHFLDHIVEWVKNPESDRGLLLLGQAGTGKSSIAHEIALQFDETSRYLSSYVAFVRKEKAKESSDEAYHFFTTLARGLSDRYPQFKLALKRAIASDPSFGTTRDPRRLFTRLLVIPLKSVPLVDPILIIIDGLDESGITIGGDALHTFLAERLIDLPSNVRILITSRSEDDIEQAFAKAESVHTLYMDDDHMAANTTQDISLYIQSKLRKDVFDDHGSKLVQASQGLFQWAAVACGFITSPANLGLSYHECVQRLLAPSRGLSGEGPLDNLYEEVLQWYFNSDQTQVLFRSIMGQLFAAVEPLSINSLIALRQHAPVVHPQDSNLVLRILRCLGSLLSNVTSHDQTRPILPLHTSFRDFLTSKTSKVFYVDLTDAHHDLSHSCLGLMLDGLKFNMCRLESSYLANSDVPDLESRITKYIPSALQYGCIYWSDHLCRRLAFDHEVLNKVRSLFETKFLFWLEVLSVKKSVGVGSRALSSLSVWLLRERSQTEVKNLLGLAKDASSFVRYFGKAVARSAPHIYVSALPFTPTSSQILHQYLPQFPRTLRLERGRLSHWPELEMTIEAHDESIDCLAFSSDGERIASTSYDGTIRVWDATTGQIIAGPFTGHTEWVTSVAFSPDGERIASGSSDDTIRVWDATTGQIIAGPFTGHTDYPISVAFSPDGERIASASNDHTILVWDATTGQIIAGPFTGHTEGVRSVVFSPDGERIASASGDCTIRVWDATTGQIVAGPFTGHTNWVESIAFSPDGERIASPSYDGTIRVWDATTGQIVAGPFTGHTYPVISVASSPDGERIALALEDHTIWVWDATTGQIVAGPSPFTGHTDYIRSVAFSRDGERIASASYDRTIRVWDATTRQIIAGPFTGHTNWVTSVAFSPDGEWIASASNDCTIRVWDATTGQIIAGPFTGHTNYVTSVTFSPDGERIASASSDHTIRVWDATTGQIIAGPFTGHTEEVRSVVFSPDGERIASASYDRTIRVWDATTGRIIAGPFIGHTDYIRSLAFSRNGERIALASDDHTIRVWDATTGHITAGPFTGHTDYVTSVAFSPDGERIASASNDGTIRVWDATTGQIIAGPFTGHTDYVGSVAFSPDGERIASGSDDHTIRVWDATTGQIIAGPFTGHTDPVGFVAFSPDGERIASASWDHTIRVWDATTRHIASASDNDTIHAKTATMAESIKNQFTDQSLIDSDGWLHGEEDELVLWIPELHRLYLHRPSTIWIAGKHGTRLDLSDFAYGSNWATSTSSQFI
ncbi:quinon protein alcohol dehydrogenase-like superfamily [Lactifluus volemus]|nr:quinon protein alcohol dehydrogenase-like superfamily [Lactifluus volemus]